MLLRNAYINVLLRKKKKLNRREVSKWCCRKVLNLPSPRDAVFKYKRNISLGKRLENWMNRTSTTKNKRTTLRCIIEAEIRASQEKVHIPAAAIHNLAGSQRYEFFNLGIKRFQLHIRHLNPQMLHRRDEPQIIGCENQRGIHPGKPQNCRE